MSHVRVQRSSEHEQVVYAKLGPFGVLKVTPLMKACAEGDHAAALAELEQVPPEQLCEELLFGDDHFGSTPLHWASYSGNADIVAALLSRRADPTVHNRLGKALPLHLAARYLSGSASVVSMLCKAAPETVSASNAENDTPLHESAYEGRTANVQALVDARASVDATNSHARGRLTPLLAAALRGHVDVALILLRAGADASIVPSGRIPGLDTALLSSGAAGGDGHSTGATRLLKRQKTSVRRATFTPALGMDSSATELLAVKGHGALSVALRWGQLRVASALLSWYLQQHGTAPYLFTRVQLTYMILRIWAVEQPPTDALTQDETVRLFTLLVLCGLPHGLKSSATSSDGSRDGDEGGDGGGDTVAAAAAAGQPPNPVLLALQLASSCIVEAPNYTRDAIVSERLQHAAVLLEHIASGFLHGAVISTVDASELTKSFNAWRTGKAVIDPAVARDFFVESALSIAADYVYQLPATSPPPPPARPPSRPPSRPPPSPFAPPRPAAALRLRACERRTSRSLCRTPSSPPTFSTSFGRSRRPQSTRSASGRLPSSRSETTAIGSRAPRSAPTSRLAGGWPPSARTCGWRVADS